MIILGIVPLTMIFSLGLALLANQKLKGLSFIKVRFHAHGYLNSCRHGLVLHALWD